MNSIDDSKAKINNLNEFSTTTTNDENSLVESRSYRGLVYLLLNLTHFDINRLTNLQMKINHFH